MSRFEPLKDHRGQAAIPGRVFHGVTFRNSGSVA